MDLLLKVYCVFATFVMIVDWIMARIPNAKQPKWLKNADGFLHFLEIQGRSIFGLAPLPGTQDAPPQIP